MVNINLMPKGNTKQSRSQPLKLGDQIRIIGPFIEDANCSGQRFEGQTGVIVALGHMKSDVDFRLCFVEFDDSTMCGIGHCALNKTASSCNHLPVSRMMRTMVITKQMKDIIPQRKGYKLLSVANVILATDDGEEPKNNDGRPSCFWCGKATKNVPGFTIGSYDLCEACGK